MTKTKKSLITLLCLFLTACLLIIYQVADKNVSNVFAESTQKVLSAADYTDSDYLINEDGLPIKKKIDEFSQDVSKAAYGALCPEITQVIPKQYMESEENNATFAYNGKEYGFYVVKEGSYFDTLSLG